MDFGAPNPELMRGARNAVQTCLGVRAGEQVALIADEASRSVAASISAALDKRKARRTGFLLEALGPRPMAAAPAEVLNALETADVGVLCMTPQPGELAARMAIVKVVERRQIRYAHMVGVTPPLTLTIKVARLVDVACARKDLEQEFWDYCHTDENSDRVGELAFGTNLGLTEMIGVLLQDEKFPGVHLAFGDPYGSQTHADWKSTTHVDVLTRQCDVWIDDDQVIDKGRYQLNHLGLG